MLRKQQGYYIIHDYSGKVILPATKGQKQV